MPRRPKNSARKNKQPRPLRRSDARVKKWNTLSDIPLDEEDQFHASRDRILLDGENVDQDFEGEDEVFALKGLENAESDEEEDYRQGIIEDDETNEFPDPKSTKAKSSMAKNKKSEKGKAISPSTSEESEEDEESWGQKASAYYASNAAQIESDDEEALELEENEAQRLQAKAREEMEDNDFGLHDQRDEQVMEGDDFNLIEPAPAVLPSLPNDKKSILRYLEKNNPEALALAGDWDDSAQSLFRTRAKLEKLQSENPDALSVGMIHLYYQTLLTYTTNLAFYLHLRTDEKCAQRPESLKTHPIMARLLTLKRGLATLEDLDFAPSESEDGTDAEDEDMELDGLLDERKRGHSGLDSLELSELLEEALLHQEEIASESQADALPNPPKKKRKTSDDASKHSELVFDLVEPEFKPTKKSKHSAQDMVPDIYGEALTLQQVDAADKNARRKSLRFHTSKIESASARRQGARQALGGDDDIPYRERQKQKEARLSKESKERVKNQGGADLDDTPPGLRSKSESNDDDSDQQADLDGYYNLVKKRSKQNKERKKADYEAERATLRQSVDEASMDGPRSLTKAILSNRGLTPRRPKSARNPRVRKREKYDKVKKKVSSQKAVYKGGLSETGGRYEGEKSGISKVVKSVRLA